MTPRSSRHGLAALWLATLGLTAVISRQDSSPSVDVPSTEPEGVSNVIDPDYCGLAFEQASFIRYAEDDNGNTNSFSANLMESIYSRTGGKPILRLGGTSPDYGEYLPGQSAPALPVAEQDNYQDVGHTTIGPSYWKRAANFPSAVYMVQVPLAPTNVSETVQWAKAAVNGIGLDQIFSIQIGNEPDLYANDYKGEGGVYLGPPDYQGTLNNQTYVGNYTKHADAILDEMELPSGFFTAFDVAARVDDPYEASYTMDLETCFDLGIDDGNILKEVSHHYYQNNAGGADDLESGLMDLAETHKRMDYHKVRINYLRDNHPNLPFIFNEVGNSLSTTNSYAYQNRLGSTLWQVDFYLYGMSIGVARINYQQIMHAGYNLWLPVASAGYDAQVFANYYSQPFVADFIGDSGNSKMAKVDISNSDGNLAAYVAYESGVAKRAALINMNYWNGTESSADDRSSTTISLNSLKSSSKSVSVKRLTSPNGAGADASSISYGGSKWTYESSGKEVKDKASEDAYTVDIEDGTANIVVRASEAVLVTF